MKVLFDHQIFDAQSAGGISRYFNELITNFNQCPDIEVQLPPMHTNNIYIRNNASYTSISNTGYSLSTSLYQFFHPNKSKKRLRNANLRASIVALKNGNFDIFHPTYYDPYFLQYLDGKPFVLTMYDMTYAKFANLFPENDKTLEQIRLLAKKANMIIAISQNTKNDVMQILKIPDNKIKVIYLGNSLVPHNTSSFNAIAVPDNYLLFVGRRGLYKNFAFFISSIANLLISTNLFLVCIGGGKFSIYEIKLLKKLKIKKRVLHLSSKNDNELSQYYARAKALCFPSKYEGFGLPILEAFANNCPVVASNTSSLPEVAGNAALYFDPANNQSISDAVKIVLTDNDLRENMISLGQKQLGNFSWQNAARQTKELYAHILNNL